MCQTIKLDIYHNLSKWCISFALHCTFHWWGHFGLCNTLFVILKIILPNILFSGLVFKRILPWEHRSYLHKPLSKEWWIISYVDFDQKIVGNRFELVLLPLDQIRVSFWELTKIYEPCKAIVFDLDMATKRFWFFHFYSKQLRPWHHQALVHPRKLKDHVNDKTCSSFQFYLILLKLYHGRSLAQNHFEFLEAKSQPVY